MMTKSQLLQLYYGLFNSIATYGVIGWDGLYETTYIPLQRLQGKILKIIGEQIIDHNSKSVLTIKRTFVLNAITFEYNELKERYTNCSRETRNKSLCLTKFGLSIGQISYKYYAVYFYNRLPNTAKTLVVNKKVLKKKLKENVGM